MQRAFSLLQCLDVVVHVHYVEPWAPKQNSLCIYLQEIHSLGATETLLCYSPNSTWGPTESTFQCNINFLVSIRSHLAPQSMLKIFCVQIANWGRRTLYSFHPVKHPHPLCLHCSVTGDVNEIRETANRG